MMELALHPDPGAAPAWHRALGRRLGSTLAGLAILTVTGLSLPGAALAQEDRCTELGGACDCSEPMDTSASRIGDGHNFSDSPGSTDCSRYGNGAYFGTNNAGISQVSETGMPAGNTVDRVVEIPSNGGDIVWLLGRQQMDSSIRRSCVRFYKKVTTDYSGVGPNNIGCPSERNKIIQFQFGGSQVQLQERSDGGYCTGPGTGNDYNPITITNPALGNFNLEPRVDFGDCSGDDGWCRIEMCGQGNLAAGTNIRFEAKITRLESGQEHYGRQTQSWNPGSGLRDWTGADLFHGQGDGGTGTEWVSHFMQASWTSDSGQWIGAAYEIEGGDPGPGGGSGGGDPTPEPDPEPLIPPVMLPGIEGGEVATDGLIFSITNSGGAPTASASVANGTGPYHFLFDCNVDGQWNGVMTTAAPSASYTCSAGTQTIKAQLWDEGSNQVYIKQMDVPD